MAVIAGSVSRLLLLLLLRDRGGSCAECDCQLRTSCQQTAQLGSGQENLTGPVLTGERTWIARLPPTCHCHM